MMLNASNPLDTDKKKKRKLDGACSPLRDNDSDEFDAANNNNNGTTKYENNKRARSDSPVKAPTASEVDSISEGNANKSVSVVGHMTEHDQRILAQLLKDAERERQIREKEATYVDTSKDAELAAQLQRELEAQDRELAEQDRKKQIEKDEELARALQNEKEAERVAQQLQPHPKTVTCTICFDDVDYGLIHTLGECKHEYCRDCLNEYFKGRIDDKTFPIVCPTPKCGKEVSSVDLELILEPAYFERFQTASLNAVLENNPDQFSCCPTPDCGYRFIWFEGDDPHFRCEKCRKRYCLKCKCDYHTGRTCIQYQKAAREAGKLEQLFNDFVTGMKFKSCPRCKVWVEKSSGCNHITCRCGNQFCYHCGRQFPCTCGQDPHVE